MILYLIALSMIFLFYFRQSHLSIYDGVDTLSDIKFRTQGGQRVINKNLEVLLKQFKAIFILNIVVISKYL